MAKHAALKRYVAAVGENIAPFAIDEAFSEATSMLAESYLIDETVRSKLLGLILKLTESRLRTGYQVKDRHDIETVALLAVRRFERLRSRAILCMIRPSDLASLAVNPIEEAEMTAIYTVTIASTKDGRPPLFAEGPAINRR